MEYTIKCEFNVTNQISEYNFIVTIYQTQSVIMCYEYRRGSQIISSP